MTRYREPDANPTVYVGLPRDQMAAVADAAEDVIVGPSEVDRLNAAAATIRNAIATTDAANATGSHATSQAPTRRDGGRIDDYIEEHPAYGLIGASRVQSTGATLFGSDFQHQGYVVIRVHGASLYRGLSSDRVHADRAQIVEVALSEAQWASFVSTLNVGDGVPCTIDFRDGMHMPHIEPITDRREQARNEVGDTLRDSLGALAELLADGRLNKADRSRVERAKREIESNLPFVVQRADEHVEETIEKAKIEVDAWMTAAIQRAGLQALGGVAPPIKLADPMSSLPSAAAAEEDGSEAGSATR